MTDIIDLMTAAAQASYAPDPEFGLTDGQMNAAMRAAVCALHEAGYRIVPVEPTEEMWSAGVRTGLVKFADMGPARPEIIYRAMLSAAPTVIGK